MNIRKVSMKLLFLFTCLIMAIVDTEALNVEKNIYYLNKGEDKEVIVSTNVQKDIVKINFSVTYSTYDVRAEFRVNDNYSASTSTIYTEVNFREPVSGEIELGNIIIRVDDKPTDNVGKVSVTDVIATTTEGEILVLNPQHITVNVIDETNIIENKVDTAEDNNLLESINSNLVNINVKKDVFEYYISIPDNIKILDLVPVAKDNSYNVSVSSQVISELSDDKILITVKNNKKEVVYTINVRVEESIEIDTSKVPEYSYKGKWGIVIGVLLGILGLTYLINKIVKNK